MNKSVLAILACTLIASAAHADRPRVVRPLDGYVCARLNATEAQMLNPNGPGIYILAEPRPNAAPLVMAPGIVFARTPAHTVGGFTEVLTVNNAPGWIASDKIRPFDATARCVPSLMSNGRIGAG